MDHNKYVILEKICFQIAQTILGCVPRRKNRSTDIFHEVALYPQVTGGSLHCQVEHHVRQKKFTFGNLYHQNGSNFY
jgi:hypothetical protein